MKRRWKNLNFEDIKKGKILKSGMILKWERSKSEGVWKAIFLKTKGSIFDVYQFQCQNKKSSKLIQWYPDEHISKFLKYYE